MYGHVAVILSIFHLYEVAMPRVYQRRPVRCCKEGIWSGHPVWTLSFSCWTIGQYVRLTSAWGKLCGRMYTTKNYNFLSSQRRIICIISIHS